MTQGLLPFQYESEASAAGLTGLAGLPLYLELWRAVGLDEAVARHVAVSGAQGWSDRQMVSALILVNLAGGDGLDDLDRLEADGGLGRLVRAAEAYGQSRRERRGAGGGSGCAICPRRMRRAGGLRGFTTPRRRRGGKPDGRSSRSRAAAWRAYGG